MNPKSAYDQALERAREDATAQFIRGESPSRIYNWLCKYYIDLPKETIAQIAGYTPPVEPVEPDYFLKVTKQEPPNGTSVDWYIYTSIGSRLGPFARDGALHFIDSALAASQETDKLLKLRRERDELDKQIKELEA